MNTQVPDQVLTERYEQDGIFSKIIDAPADEAISHGFILEDLPIGASDISENTLDDLEFDDAACTAIKWARLYGGSIIVMLADDGGGLEDSLCMEKIKSVDGLRVYDRSQIMLDPEDEGNTELPETFQINSLYGSFTVHSSRCLFFRNGSQFPEKIFNRNFMPFGIPELYRIEKELHEAYTAHSKPVRMLERAIQPVFKISNLSAILSTEEGERQMQRRLEVMDLARGLFNTIVVDSEDDFYFAGEVPAGTEALVDVSEMALSAVTSIPPLILWGKMNRLGDYHQLWRKNDEGSFRTWYSLVERIQKYMIQPILHRLLSVIFQASVNTGELEEVPPINIHFPPLWQQTELEKAEAELNRAKTQLSTAQMAHCCIEAGVMQPSEVRRYIRKQKHSF
ncbi:MAG: anti-CBASS protein Acb1 family protein [Faecousia sp.]